MNGARFTTAVLLAGLLGALSGCASSIVTAPASPDLGIIQNDSHLEQVSYPVLSECASSTASPGPTDYLNRDLDEYGLLFFDAQSEKCAGTAYTMLRAKLEGSLAPGILHTNPDGLRETPPFQGWLEGAHVQMIHVTALILGGRGMLDSSLNELVMKVGRRYTYNQTPDCGVNLGNTCFDEQTQAAVGYAWIAAYAALSGQKELAANHARNALNVLHAGLAPENHLCVPAADLSRPAVNCASIQEIAARLDSGEYVAIVFNHGFENQGYAIGLMTSAASALLGLKIAGMEYSAEDAARDGAVARSLYRRAEKVIASGASWKSACLIWESGENRFRTDFECADLGYTPDIFPVAEIYERYYGIAPADGSYGFGEFNGQRFAPAIFLNMGRKAVYGHLAYHWWTQAPALAGHL